MGYSVLTEFKNRGLRILIACVDGLKGFPDAINSVYPQIYIQQSYQPLIQKIIETQPIYIFDKKS